MGGIIEGFVRAEAFFHIIGMGIFGGFSGHNPDVSSDGVSGRVDIEGVEMIFAAVEGLDDGVVQVFEGLSATDGDGAVDVIVEHDFEEINGAGRPGDVFYRFVVFLLLIKIIVVENIVAKKVFADVPKDVIEKIMELGELIP